MTNQGIVVSPGRLYRPLEEEQLPRLHQASLDLLWETGIEVNHPQALALFAEKGANVDGDKKRVHLPGEMVEKAISSAPSRVLLAGREEEYDLSLEHTRVYLGGGGVCEKVMDLETGEKRQAMVDDIGKLARLAQGLEHVHFLQFTVQPPGLPAKNANLHHYFHMLKNTTKHVMCETTTKEELDKVVRLAEVISGGKEKLLKRPILSFLNCLMISPLRVDTHMADRVMDTAAVGLPQALPTAPICGVTAPMTLAGTALMQNAECLAGITLTQLVNPGTPVLYSVVSSVADMSSLSFRFGAVELGILAAAGSQMARYYQVPIYATGGTTEADGSSQQTGYEKALTLLSTALSGANFIHDTAGLLDSVFTASYEQMVIDDEINGMVLRILKGIDFDAEKMAFSVISQMGPGGNFLSSRHTLKHLHGEHYQPQLSRFLQSSPKGQDTLRANARIKAKKLLENMPLPPFSPEALTLLKKELPELFE